MLPYWLNSAYFYICLLKGLCSICRSFCDRLSDPENKENTLKVLSCLGGATVKESVARCIDALLINSMQHKFNRVGSKGGEAFAAFLKPLLKKVVMAAFPAVTQKDVEIQISNGFAELQGSLGRSSQAIKPDRRSTTSGSRSAPLHSDDSDCVYILSISHATSFLLYF